MLTFWMISRVRYLNRDLSQYGRIAILFLIIRRMERGRNENFGLNKCKLSAIILRPNAYINNMLLEVALRPFFAARNLKM